MRARCAQCHFIFPVEGDGVQVCPNCGANLDLDILQGQAPTADPQDGFTPGPDPVGASGARQATSEQGKIPTPWERRAEIGFFKGLIDTVILSVKNPVGFFSGMPASNANGAITYYWIVGGFSVIAASIWAALLSLLSGDAAEKISQFEALAQSSEQMGEASGAFFEVVLPLLSMVANPIATLFCQILSALILTPIQLLIVAGIYHLSALVLGAARNGFNATLRAIGYAAGPLLLGVIPLCGAAVGGLAYTVFAIIGIARLQQVSYGKAVLVCLLPIILGFICACASSFAIFGLAFGSMANEL